MKIATRIGWTLLIAGTVGTLLTTFVVYQLVYGVLEARMSTQQEERAQELMDAIDGAFGSSVTWMQQAAIDPRVLACAQEDRSTCDHDLEQKSLSGSWDLIYLMNREGAIVGASSSELLGTHIDGQSVAMMERARSTTVASDIKVSSQTGFPTIYFATPIGSDLVLIAQMDISVIQNVLGSVHTVAVLHDVRGSTVLSNVGQSANGTIGVNEYVPEFARLVLSQTRGSATVSGLQGTGVLFSYVPSSETTSRVSTGWGMTLQTPAFVAFAPVRSVAIAVAFLLMLLIAIFIFILYVVIRRSVVGPILALQHQMEAPEERAGGATVQGPDEIVLLSNAFRDMWRRVTSTKSWLEGEVELRTADLRNERDQVQAVLSSVREGLVVLDGTRHIVAFNPAAMQMIGVEGNVVGRQTREIFSVLKDGQDLDVEHWPGSRTIATGEPIRIHESDNYSLRRKDGSTFPVIFSTAPLIDPSGSLKTHGAVVVFRDISDEKESEKKIHELNELRTRFIQIVSHQLRTPLNAIRWNLEAMIAEELGTLQPAQKEFLHVTYSANLEVIKRIHDLLTAMDIEQGRIALNTSEVETESVWGSVMGDWKKACGVKNITCRYLPLAVAIPSVEADADKLHEIFAKLTENSAMYTAEGGSVDAHFIVKEHGIRFEITDTGIGIPAAEQKKIFTRFFRGSNASTMKTDASGLGLSIAKYFVEQHRGTMGFVSVEGKGSTFWFEIPFKQPSV